MSKSRFITTLLMLFTVMALITCDMPLGLGDPVDTTPPHITILSPSDGQWMNDHNRGEPIMLRGTWWDDTGVTEIRILDQKSGEYFTNENYNLNGITIEPAGADGNGTWSAEIVITESGEHTIRVIAFDSFRNQGADIVNIRVDLVDPLVEDAKVLRYLDRGSLSNRFITEESIYNFAHYDEELDFQSPYFYRRIKWADIDKFQNEAFTLRVDFADSYANVVTSRLYVLDENGDRLNPGSEDIDGLVPTRNYDPYKPEWDITAGQLISWNPKYATGASYISFEVFVWNEANWEFDAPKEGGTRRQQRIFGTCWYPESDIPKIAVQATDDALSSGQIFLNTTTVGALSLEVYDDDQLAQIYAGLILKEEFDDLRGSESEADYLSSLVTDTARRDQVIAKLSNNNLFSVADSGEDRRRQIIRLDTGAAGEYRLIAMVRDNKGPESHYFSTPNTPAWAVHPPLRVHVQNPNAPNIIVETPAAENTFPMLSRSGENYEFNVSGYNIDDTGILWMQIAWVPPSFTISDAQAALRAAAGSLEPGESTTQSGIKIWRISVDPNEPVVLNGVNYVRNNFSHTFNLLTDFEGEARRQKTLVFHSMNIGESDSFRTFRLAGYENPPALTLHYPFQEMLIHDTNQNLVLRFEAQAPFGIGIKPESMIITDVTEGNTDPEFGFTNNPPPLNNIKTRTVPSDFIRLNFGEGSRRTYRFEAEDILGNRNQTNRTIIMSNVPALLYITSNNGPGLYKAGDVLRFEAVFSMPVRINRGPGSGPRLKLYFTDPGLGEPAFITNPKNGDYAEYVEGFTGNTIVFSYTVKAGDAGVLHTSLNPIDLNGATLRSIETIEGGDDNATIVFLDQDNSLQNAFKDGGGQPIPMTIDGVAPTITRASFRQPGTTGASYFNNGKTVTLELLASKRVQVSGSPRAYLTYGANTAIADYSRTIQNIDGTSTLEFTWIVNAPANLPETQLTWASQWITYQEGDAITDLAGNPLDISAAARPTGGNLNGDTANRTAWIVTQIPATPTLTIHATNTGTPAITAEPLRVNATQYLRVQGAATNTLFYSLQGGMFPLSITPDAFAELADVHAPDRDDTVAYQPSEYAVIAWQVDRAGNRSPNTDMRNVTINSRAPELDAISCNQPDGSYPQGRTMTFRLHFSRPVQATADHNDGALIRLTLEGTAAGYTDNIQINMVNGANRALSSIFEFQFTVPAGLRMRDIKVTRIDLSGVIDEYGNELKTWLNIPTENTTQRPLTMTSEFNLQRPALSIISRRPFVQTYSPAAPTSTGAGSNGGLMTTGMDNRNRITLTFDRDVWAQAGGEITIRPYGRWALPPILETAEFNEVYNSSFPALDLSRPGLTGMNETQAREEYRRRLMWVNPDGIPAAPFNANGSHLRYNVYKSNTNGLVQVGGLVRPDTRGKWVLDFEYDLYGGADESLIRDVFNAHKYRWLEMPSNSGSVSINQDNRRIVTITLPNDYLLSGRIWEVIINEGAFRDVAGNDSEAVTNYRFWSDGVATPVIRVDKHSHGDHYQGRNFRGDQQTLPKIDTRVRIDSETPGANIYFDTIRTMYRPAVGGEVFTSNNNTAAGFFNHPNVDSGTTGRVNGNFTTANPGGNSNQGFNNNTIGNSGNQTPVNNTQFPIPRDANGFFTGLLVPITVQTGTAALPISQNGAILWSALPTNPATYYQTTNTSTGVTTYSRPSGPLTADGKFFFVGDAYNGTSDTATGITDERLYTGRRDYIVAIARKQNSINGGESAGPYLNGSSQLAYEGVFKTTVLYRDPGMRSNRFLIQGFDEPVVPATPGFPLRLTYVGTPPAPFSAPQYTYYTKQAYRQGGTLPNDGEVGIVNADDDDDEDRSDRNNNYIWVSWDIITDWYQMARIVGNQFNFLQRNNFNYNGVLATYGAVTYRYRQQYTGGVVGGNAAGQDPSVTQ